MVLPQLRKEWMEDRRSIESQGEHMGAKRGAASVHWDHRGERVGVHHLTLASEKV